MPQKIHHGVNGHKELDRVINSVLFSHSDSLRRLLRYLVQKSIAGEADELKEFTVGVEALGKPEDYNPQLDPSVRVQVGRLRRKLEEYYQTEGKSDLTRISLPKRHFKIVIEKYSQVAKPPPEPVRSSVGTLRLWQGIGGTAVLAALLFAALAFHLGTRADRRAAAETGVALTPEQLAFWSPYIEGTRPTLICIGIPMFVWFEGSTGTFVRDPLVNDWPLQPGGEKFESLARALRGVPSHPVYEYTGVGEAMGAFLLGKQLAAAGLNTTLIRSNHFSWDEAKRANVVYFGAPKNTPHLRDEQFQASFRVVAEGVENAHPQPGEQTLYGREVLPNGRPRWTHAVIRRSRAKDEYGYVTALSSWDGPGSWAAVEYLSRPDSMRNLDQLLRGGRNEYPTSFEVVVRAEFKQEFPVNVTYVAHRVH